MHAEQHTILDVRITMVLFVLKGGILAEISTIRNKKNRKNFKLG
jgi:hypothetical protein